MALKERIQEDMKTAMRSGEKERLMTVRMLLAKRSAPRAVRAAFDDQMRRNVPASPGARVERDDRITRQVADDDAGAVERRVVPLEPPLPAGLQHPDLPVVIISGHGNIETAVRATKLGAFDFIEKPLSIEKTVLTVRNALRQQKLELINADMAAALAKEYTMVGESVAMRALRNAASVWLSPESPKSREWLFARLSISKPARAKTPAYDAGAWKAWQFDRPPPHFAPSVDSMWGDPSPAPLWGEPVTVAVSRVKQPPRMVLPIGSSSSKSYQLRSRCPSRPRTAEAGVGSAT